MFGAGGGTSSYEEVANTDLMLLWGSNARAAHPIFFHHVLKGIHNGMRLVVVDPRRTESAEWGDLWLGLDVGSDIGLSNTIAREIIASDLQHHTFIERATLGFDEYRDSVMDWTLERGEQVTGVPADVIREVAHAYAKADRAMICWTLGITEHHNAVDNVLALINLALLTGHVGVYGSGVNPLRGQNNVQGGGDMGAIPNKLAGFQDIERDAEGRARFEAAWGVPIAAEVRLDLTQMFEAMERGELTAAYVIGENPAIERGRQAPTRWNCWRAGLPDRAGPVHDQTAELADVVFPAVERAFESEGTVTNSERRVQRVRKALDAAGQRRDDIWIIAPARDRLGFGWGDQPARSVGGAPHASPMHAGMSWQRLEALGGLQWPCPDEEHPARCSCTPGSGRTIRRAGAEGAVLDRGRRAAGGRAVRGLPAAADDRAPAGLLQHRGADRGLHLAAATRRDDRRLARGRRTDGAGRGGARCWSSRRGTVAVPVHVDRRCGRAWCS